MGYKNRVHLSAHYISRPLQPHVLYNQLSLRVALCPRIKNETHNVQFPGFSCQWNGSWYHHLFSAGTWLHFSRCWYVWLAELWPVAVLVSALQWSGGGGRQGSWEVVTSGTRTQLCADTRRGHSSSRTSSHFHLKLEHPRTFSNVTAWQRSRETATATTTTAAPPSASMTQAQEG